MRVWIPLAGRHRRPKRYSRCSLVYAKEHGKTVIVSMGSMAASGGYWVSVDADRIFAMPSTLTGSIGVIMGKMEISKLWAKVGVNWDAISWGKNARLWSMNAPMGEGELSSMNAALDSTYNNFLQRVADGRRMPVEKVRAIAKGRAWTGTQAKGNGLVDELGGLNSPPMDYAAKIIGLKIVRMYLCRIIPEPLSPLEELFRMMGPQMAMGAYSGAGKMLENSILPALKKVETMDRLGPVQVYDLNVPVIKP